MKLFKYKMKLTKGDDKHASITQLRFSNPTIEVSQLILHESHMKLSKNLNKTPNREIHPSHSHSFLFFFFSGSITLTLFSSFFFSFLDFPRFLQGEIEGVDASRMGYQKVHNTVLVYIHLHRVRAEVIIVMVLDSQLL